MQTHGYWNPTIAPAIFNPTDFSDLIADIRTPLHMVYDPARQRLGLARSGAVSASSDRAPSALQLVATLPPLYPEWLGDRTFTEVHRVRFAYVGGAMARGIGSVPLVVSLAESGMLGFFGAAGLAVDDVTQAVSVLKDRLDPRGLSWGVNLIHTPHQPALEDRLVDIYLTHGVQRVSASAFMQLTPSVVRYSCRGLHRDAQGRVARRHHVFAKLSRPEVAEQFLSPAPPSMLDALRQTQQITPEEAELARHVPVAEDIIVEADSAGHTDNRPLAALLPTILQLREDLAGRYAYRRPIRVGAAGGLGTPHSVAAAFALGASFVVLGSVHQAVVESGLSPDAKQLLAQVELADVAMTAAADMFELGVKVQVLKRGTLMAARGNELYRLYTRYEALEALPQDTRDHLEQHVFHMSLDDVWAHVQTYFQRVDPEQIERAKISPKHRMALVFRWYLGRSSHWPITGDSDRRLDYQIWCGPAMGAFNKWVQGSFLEPVEHRSLQQVALNLLEGAAIMTRAHQLRTHGLPIPSQAFTYRPVELCL